MSEKVVQVVRDALAWAAIDTAPDGDFIDVYARRYNNRDRCWEYRRFNDAQRIISKEMGRSWVDGIPEDWEATHWREPPADPTDVEPRS